MTWGRVGALAIVVLALGMALGPTVAEAGLQPQPALDEFGNRESCFITNLVNIFRKHGLRSQLVSQVVFQGFEVFVFVPSRPAAFCFAFHFSRVKGDREAGADLGGHHHAFVLLGA